MATVRIYKVAELLKHEPGSHRAVQARHGIEVKSASSTIEEVVAREFVSRRARQSGLRSRPPPRSPIRPRPQGPKPARKAAEPPKPVTPALPPPRLIKSAKPPVAPPIEGTSGRRRGRADPAAGAAVEIAASPACRSSQAAVLFDLAVGESIARPDAAAGAAACDDAATDGPVAEGNVGAG